MLLSFLRRSETHSSLEILKLLVSVSALCALSLLVLHLFLTLEVWNDRVESQFALLSGLSELFPFSEHPFEVDTEEAKADETGSRAVGDDNEV